MSIPLPKAFWPVIITAANQAVYVRQSSTNYTANIAVGTYYSAVTLAAAVQTALNGAGASGTWTVAVTATGRFTVTNSSTAFTMYFATLTANSAAAILGFSAIDLASTSLVATAQSQHQYGWYSAVAVRRDSGTQFDREADRMTVAMGGQNKHIIETEVTKRLLLFSYLAPAKTLIASESTTINEALERWWRTGSTRFRYWPDGTVEGTSGDYLLDEDTMQSFRPTRMFDGKELYQVEFKLRGFVA